MQERLPWLPEPALPDLTTDPLQTSWLTERGSLTARLRETWGDVSVAVIEEGLATPLPHEADRLAMPHGVVAWVRCVWLRTPGRVRLYARTVIPQWGPLNPWAQVQQLGQQPLGELLFRTPGLQRSTFEWCGDGHWPIPGGGLAAAPARRCLFQRDGAPLLLTEAFLDLHDGPAPCR